VIPLQQFDFCNEMGGLGPSVSLIPLLFLLNRNSSGGAGDEL